MLEPFSETDPRVDNEAFSLDARRHRRADSFPEEACEFRQDIPVVRAELHRPGRALHVHQDEPRSASGGDVQHPAVKTSGADIVDDVGPLGQGGLGNFGLGRVHRDQDFCLFSQGLDHGEDAPQLLFRRDGFAAGPGAFSSHVDNVRAFGGELQPAADRPGRVKIDAPVVKGIRGDVEHTHEPGSPAQVKASFPGS